MRRWLSQRWLLWLVLPLALGLLTLLLPVEQRRDDPRPLIGLESNLYMSDGATLRQTVVLDDPVAEQAAFRVWALLEQSRAPYLYLRCLSAGRVVGEGVLRLPPPDRAYHALDGPWCDTLGQRNMSIVLEGNGVRLMTTAVDRVPGVLFKQEQPLRDSDLVLQVRHRSAGVDRYVPVSRWAADKPGILGWPHLYLLLPLLYLTLTGVLVQVARRWRR